MGDGALLQACERVLSAPAKTDPGELSIV
jgi:hypothetical protein